MVASGNSRAQASIRLTALDAVDQVAPASFRLRIQLLGDFINGVQEDVDASSIYLLRNGEFIELQPDVSQDRYESGLAVGTYDYVVKGVAVSYVNGSERLRQIQSSTVRITVAAPTGALSASPNPCAIPWGGSACTATVQWSSNAPNAQLWVSGLAGENPTLFAQGASGSQAASITAAGSRFQLKNGGQVLANLDARANPTVNVPPAVQVTSPTQGQVFLDGDLALLQASASDSDDAVQRVEFLISGIKVWNMDAPPYQVHWTASAGTHSVVARAFDTRGAYTDSAPVQIVVNRPPTVALTSPLPGAFRTAPGSFAVAADAADSDGSVSQVEFFVNGAKFATATSAPYSAMLDQLSAGSYALSAKVTDNHGASATSASVSVVVGAGGAGGVARSYVYDAQQRLCKTIEPETGATVVDYDAAGNVAWTAAGLNLPDPVACNRAEAAASGRAVVRSYDALGRLKTMAFPYGRGNQTWNYHPDGLAREIATDNDGNGQGIVVNRYQYNKRRLLSSESVTLRDGAVWNSANGYDANGNRISYVAPDGLQVNYTVNALGQQTGVSSTGRIYASNVGYYPNGAIRQFTYGNGIVHTLQQNARQLPSRSTDAGTIDLETGYDHNGNVAQVLDRQRESQGQYQYNRWMSYDGLDRLTAAGSCIFGGDCWHRFTYDAVDNLRSWSLAGVKNHHYVYDAKNHLTNIRDGSAGPSVIGLGYDDQGNLANKNGQEFRFDYGNRLRRVVGKEAYAYDAHGRRLSQFDRPDTTFVNSFYNLDGQLLFRYEGHTNEATNDNYPEINRPHVYLGGSLLATVDWNRATQTAQTKYYHTDALGSPVAVTNEAGQVVERTDWEPYGAAIGKPAYDGVGYTGHVMDGWTGLTYMQQRYYDPVLGRFLSVDPVTADSNSGGNFNRYWYANNNPYRFTDPDGRRVAGGCTNECTYVQINYSKVSRAPGYVHAYIVVVPKDGSTSHVVRAGPTGGRSIGGDIQAVSPSAAEAFGIKPDFKKLQAVISTLTKAPDARGPQAGSQTIVKTSASGEEVMKQLTHFVDAVNAARVNYDARGVNSNSFAFDAAQGLTGTRPAATPDPGNNALGSDRTTGVQFEP
ncbi:RHS repeat domain-containing protein [Lysobacter enzymogenes]|uniref:RHS repeat domain-containing protein n=1 Tax=Lysobacter enzymogenes TaxID=69 RepID=UPI0009CBA27B|nr:Ig-like domain-containing protein [Lysobacter enzymogenes]UZW62444.1 Ig-like domain-containing protein [Lysobacter enzymogenes]